MRTEEFMAAVGNIDDRFLDVDKPKKPIKRTKWKKRIIAASAAAVLIIGTLPTLTAFGYDRAYDVLYNIAPPVAQKFKPVLLTCEDQGIVLTVVSAERSGSKASIYLAVHDVSGSFPTGKWDLYDSYHINVPFDMTGTCSFSEYSTEDHTAYFVVEMETMDGRPMPEGKVTFGLNELVMNMTETKTTLDAIDMSKIPYEPQTTEQTEIRGGYSQDELPPAKDQHFLLSQDTPICEPAPKVSVMNIGYIDGALHILTCFKEKSVSHGFVSLIDSNGDEIGENTGYGYYYNNTINNDKYLEQIIPVSYEELSKCTLQGEYVSAECSISGDWEITFELQ